MDNRRDFIKKAAMLTGAAGLAGTLPPSLQKALAINPAPGTTWKDAEHIVMLMQENRSFDHCFGTLQGVRGFNDPRAITLPDKNKVWLQTNAKGETYAPFRLNIKDTKATWMSSLPHSWSNQVDARNNGRYDKWLDAKKAGAPYENIPMTMGYYTREDIPFYYALADAFTVCDQHFCSSLTGTTPNRLFFWTGKIREDLASKARVRNEDTDYGAEASWKTFPEVLEENGVSWKIYQNEISVGTGFEGEEDAWLANFTDNPIEWFTQYHVRLSKGYIDYLQRAEGLIQPKIEQLTSAAAAAQGSELEKINKQLARFRKALATAQEHKTIYTKEKYNQLSPSEKSIHDRAFTTNRQDKDYHNLTTLTYTHNNKETSMQVPGGDVLHQFRQDVANGSLPVVSWIVAPENFSDHPTAPWYGAWYLSEVLDILTQNPEVWKKTIFILNYDENDGCFDHVPPFVPPHSGKPETGLISGNTDTRIEHVSLEQDSKYYPGEQARESPVGLGYRVPLVIASPWSRGGKVCSEVFDLTSPIRFIEQFISHKLGKPVTETNISAWRRMISGNLTSVFTPYNEEVIPEPVFPAKENFLATIHQARFKAVPDNYKILTRQEINIANTKPSASPYMPQQEKGIRPACAIPYELYTDGNFENGSGQFVINFKAGNELFGANAAGAPFHVYSYGKELTTKAYAVAAGETLSGKWRPEKDAYSLHVYGPNGFYRAFNGGKRHPPVDVHCLYQAGKEKSLSGNIIVAVRNTGNDDLAMQLTDNAYHSGAQEKLIKATTDSIFIVETGKSFGWYDFTLRISGYDLFSQQFAGHVETGRESFTDPLMGSMA